MPTYVYGLTTPEAALRGSGVEGAAIRVVADGGVAAIVSTITAGSVDADRPNLMTHSDVLQDAVGSETIVPMRFGTVFADDDAVRSELLEARRSELVDVLERVRGHVELTVKAYYIRETVLAEIVAGDSAIASLRAATRSVPGDAGYYQRIRLGELVAAALERRRREDAAAVAARLRPLAAASKEATELPEWMVAKLSFLVPSSALDDLRARVEELALESEGRMKFALVGPLPPYSFVELEPTVGAAA